MRTDDQYFKPGDKVVRVSNGEKKSSGGIPCRGTGPVYGKIYCVEDFWEGPLFNAVMLVGCGGWRYAPNGMKVGWQASAFRKVDEIKLCVAAAERMKQPVLVQVHPTMRGKTLLKDVSIEPPAKSGE